MITSNRRWNTCLRHLLGKNEKKRSLGLLCQHFAAPERGLHVPVGLASGSPPHSCSRYEYQRALTGA